VPSPKGTFQKRGNIVYQAKIPKNLNLAIFFYFYLSDWKTENVEDASIGEIEGFN
jgi:hypothetical protein